MSDELNLEDLDLTVPGAIEGLVDKLDLDDLEEGDGNPPEDDAKRNAAFAAIRKQRTVFRKALTKVGEQLKSRGNGQGQPNSPQHSMPPGNLPPQILEILQGTARLKAQAKAATDEIHRAYPSMTPEQYQEIYSMNVITLAAQQVSARDQEKILSFRTAEVFEKATGSFAQLDEVDLKAVQERVQKLPVEAQNDPSVVKSEVHRYMGENIEKFTTKAPDSKQNTEAEDEDGDAWGPEPPESGGFRQNKGAIEARTLAGAAAASEVKSGRGVQPGEQTDKGSGKGSTGEPNKEDRQRMRETMLDPTNATHVKRYLKGKRAVSSGKVADSPFGAG